LWIGCHHSIDYQVALTTRYRLQQMIASPISDAYSQAFHRLAAESSIMHLGWLCAGQKCIYLLRRLTLPECLWSQQTEPSIPWDGFETCIADFVFFCRYDSSHDPDYISQLLSSKSKNLHFFQFQRFCRYKCSLFVIAESVHEPAVRSCVLTLRLCRFARLEHVPRAHSVLTQFEYPHRSQSSQHVMQQRVETRQVPLSLVIKAPLLVHGGIHEWRTPLLANGKHITSSYCLGAPRMALNAPLRCAYGLGAQHLQCNWRMRKRLEFVVIASVFRAITRRRWDFSHKLTQLSSDQTADDELRMSCTVCSLATYAGLLMLDRHSWHWSTVWALNNEAQSLLLKCKLIHKSASLRSVHTWII